MNHLFFFRCFGLKTARQGQWCQLFQWRFPTSEKRCPCETGSVPLLLEGICWSGSHCRCTFTAVGGDFISHELPTATSHLHRKQRSLVGRSSWNLENTTAKESNIHGVGCPSRLLGLQVPWPLILRTYRWSLRCFGLVPLVMWDKSRFCLEIAWKCLWERRWTHFQWQKWVYVCFEIWLRR